MDEMRDNLREIVRGHLEDKVRLLELEYQPVPSESVASESVALESVASEKSVASESVASKATEKAWR